MSDDVLMSSPRMGYSPGPEEEEDRYEVFMPAVQRLVNALGGYERVPGKKEGEWETIYRPGDSVLGVLKDLKKLWRKDDADDERTVARCMYQANLMSELIGLVGEVTERGEWGRKVALMACDLIAALTWPIDVAAELKELSDEGPVVSDYASLLRGQIEYKAQLLRANTLRCVLVLMLPCFAKERREEKDDRVISLCLHIVRNLLAIRDVRAPDSATGEEEELSRLQSTLIVQLDKLTFLDLFVTMASGSASSVEFNNFNMLILDVLHLIYRCIRPEELGKDQKTASSEKLASLLAKEERQKSMSKNGKSTRHSRFGTTLAVHTEQQRIFLHSQAAINADAALMLDATKRKKAPHKKRAQDELLLSTTLTSEAIVVLQKFTKDFLEYFNTFFMSVLKDIRMERQKVRPTDNVRTLFVSSVLVEYLLILRQKARERLESDAKKKGGERDKNEIKQKLDEELPLGWAAEAIDIDSLKWVTARMRMAMEEKPQAWTELQAAIECFTQILLVLEAMMSSTNEDDVEAANQIQNKLYYNNDILDASLNVMSSFTTQSYAYLDSVITFAYTLFRLLEKYSKSQAYMFVRKRKPARKRLPPPSGGPQEAPIPEEYQNDSEEDIPEERDRPEFAEHKFTFASFEKRLANAAITHTLISFLGQYKTFTDPVQFKRVVGLIYRQVVKAQAEGLYFQVSTLNLFRHMLDDKRALPVGDGTRDLFNLINFILRKFFKRLAEDQFLMVEAFLPKSGTQWRAYSSYVNEPNDDGMAGQRARIREQMGPAELEFVKKHNLSWSDKMAVAIRMLLDADHEEWVRWIISVLEVVLAARTEVVLAVDGEAALLRHDSDDEDNIVRDFSGPSKDAQEKFVRHDLDAHTDELRDAVTSNQHLRLMLRLVAFEQTDEESNAARTWYIPSTVLPDSLKASIGALESYLANPPRLDKDPKTLLRAKRRAKSPQYNSDGEEVVRVRKPRQRKKEELQVYKSAAYIEDSDDDAGDDAFFANEARLRAEMNALAEASGSTMRRAGTKRKRKGKVVPVPLADMDRNLPSDEEDEDKERKSNGDEDEGDKLYDSDDSSEEAEQWRQGGRMLGLASTPKRRRKSKNPFAFMGGNASSDDEESSGDEEDSDDGEPSAYDSDDSSEEAEMWRWRRDRLAEASIEQIMEWVGPETVREVGKIADALADYKRRMGMASDNE